MLRLGISAARGGDLIERDSTPRESPAAAFRADPLSWLTAAASVGRTAVIDPTYPVLTRDPAAVGSLAVFGAPQIRAVLADLDRFRMPLSVALRDRLPDTLVNLNSGVFSMAGPLHRERQQALAGLLSDRGDPATGSVVSSVVEPAVADVVDAGEIDLLTWARDLAGRVSERLVFGEAGAGTATFVRRYFDLRRRHSASPSPGLRATLIDAGIELDAVLRERIRVLPRDSSGAGVLGELVADQRTWRNRPTEDELVAHANILMASSNEPVATSLTWLLLTLTQHRELITDLRRSVRAHHGDQICPAVADCVLEGLRLVPPNAVMVRVSSCDTKLAETDVPAGTEVVLSPYVEHRRTDTYREPDRFDPARWRTERPNPYQFLPFGVGARACLGRGVARHILGRVATSILARGTPVLRRDSVVDWRMSVTLAPVGELPVCFTSAIPPESSGGVLGKAQMLIGSQISS